MAGGATATPVVGAPMIWAQDIKNITLRHIGVSYSVVSDIGQQASKDLGFKVVMQNLDTSTAITRFITQPQSVDIPDLEAWQTKVAVPRGILQGIDIKRIKEFDNILPIFTKGEYQGEKVSDQGISAYPVMYIASKDSTKIVPGVHDYMQPIWTLLQLLPFIAIAYAAPQAFHDWSHFAGLTGKAQGFHFALFGAAASVVFSLMGQIGEQVDFLRFMPEKRTDRFDWKWWGAMVWGGPGWIMVGALKMLAGSLLTVIALRHGLSPVRAAEPVDMYRIGFGYVFQSNAIVVSVTVLFVILSQIKINVTNAYAGSIAWSNFFARLTHSHPGRVIWLLFNVAIALLLAELGVYRALGTTLAIYSNLAVAWIGALVADLVVNKPLGLSPHGIEFKRAYLKDTNPVGFGGMTLGGLAALRPCSFSPEPSDQLRRVLPASRVS
ncbi:hypothetical protein ASILVAE211_21235 [Acidisoma silvae]|uniref:Uncharacterized protein n=1 Tax=Acidisoma silvae TaxID=2802396 RepID=A0A963YV76_9PROT|nr:hypothetical protein [Acidisoma silvae]